MATIKRDEIVEEILKRSKAKKEDLVRGYIIKHNIKKLEIDVFDTTPGNRTYWFVLTKVKRAEFQTAILNTILISSYANQHRINFNVIIEDKNFDELHELFVNKDVRATYMKASDLVKKD